ncbi:transmembrane emp24 domain-containing protein eca-like isoform X1 [Amphibalanus amphitrite]|uniref:transmembrane emp24 domain-containing protein eca-like isoform X1 n=1 Tax=Amphibalanus amphitrite TaxID=1232801 RepID=UPI001C8FF35C|nr:transmembrane emp24 domain-containing protein eca-like isoform X1 [Amphibalanus amphitrite]
MCNKMNCNSLMSAFILLFVIHCVNGLYFHIAETERKCFIEEIPDETMITGKYKTQLFDPRTGGFMQTNQGIGMHVDVRDPEDKPILSARVHLDISVGDQAVDYAVVAKREKLTELQLRVRQLLDQVEQISKEQNYQRYREERFRSTSESTNGRVLWWSLAQTCVLLAMGYWQMRHLKSFFEAKKLV